MTEKYHKASRQKNLTDRLLDGDVDDDRLNVRKRFSQRSAGAQRQKMERTALLRAAEGSVDADLETLPVGSVIQVYSLFCDVKIDDTVWLCVVRKTLAKLSATAVVVGDRVRIRDIGSIDESGRPEAVIEQIMPRVTLLTRTDSFKESEQQPIVANAEQMLIVASLREPEVRWGLVNRMIVAARGGGLAPIVCLNKIDLGSAEDHAFAAQVLKHYRAMNIATLQTSVTPPVGLDELRKVLSGRTTVLAGHSGVGKSSLIRAIQPALDLRIGAISGYTGKGRHTTSSAKCYPLDFGGQVVDTPGVKVFGLWKVTRTNLKSYFEDVQNETAPAWRRESYERILETLAEGSEREE